MYHVTEEFELQWTTLQLKVVVINGHALDTTTQEKVTVKELLADSHVRNMANLLMLIVYFLMFH